MRALNLVALTALTACTVPIAAPDDAPEDTVTQTGDDDDVTTPTTTNPPVELPPCSSGSDIQAAIDQAGDGDTIYVCPGTHGVNLVLDGNVTLDAQDPDQDSILDAGRAGPAIRVPAAGTATVRNLVLINGDGGPNHAGGIEASDATHLFVVGCDLHENQGRIGGIQGPLDGAVDLEAVDIRDNTGVDAGGLAMGNGSLLGVHVFDNDSTVQAGGVWIYAFGAPSITDTDVYSNTTEGLGGGVVLEWGSTLRGGIIEGNTAANGGGVAALALAQVTLSGATIQNNEATVAGGGFWNAAAIGGVLTFASTHIIGNTAPIGGGLYVQTALDGLNYMGFDNSFVKDNTADEGAGMALSGIAVSVGDATLTGNVAYSAGGGVSLLNGASLDAARLDVGDEYTANAPQDVDIDGLTYDYDGMVAFNCYTTCN